jgi:hypothetical protein
MTTVGTHVTSGPPAARSWGNLLADRHFLAAVLILAASAAGWNAWVRLAKLATVKYPVPWPAGVQVNEGYRMTSLAERIGPYAFVSGDGVLEFNKDGTPHKDGKPDGLGVMTKETLEMLKIGTSADEKNLPRRRSNWFMIRTYEDTRVPARHPLRFWRLEAYYYTGGVDRVPHVPEICAVMGGATHLRTVDLPVTIPGAPAPWGGTPVKFQQAVFQANENRGEGSAQFAQYYIFSLNGAPEGDRTAVRLTLASPFVRHAYFAKIQFYPLIALPDPAEAREAAKDFAARVLPDVLKALPMPEDIRKLDESGSDAR